MKKLAKKKKILNNLNKIWKNIKKWRKNIMNL